MDNYDTLYKKYQQASVKDEAKEFPAMDKVWTRLEDKLDAKVHKSQSKTWKKMAIAASVLLLVSLGYQIFKPIETIIPETEVVETENNPAKIDVPEIIPDAAIISEEPIVSIPKSNPNIRQDADEILKKQIGEQEALGYEPRAKVSIMSGSVVVSDSVRADTYEMDELAKSPSLKEKSNSAFKNRIFEAKSVQKTEAEDDKTAGNFVPKSYAAKSVQTKSDPLVVVDGETVKSGLKDIDSDEIESYTLLPNPLYIINGVEYSEESLFGKSPTSPYAPLDKQEIESIKVFQAEEAIKTYGKKGEKGVVVIITKNGKPIKRQ